MVPAHAPWSRTGEILDWIREIRPARAFPIHDGALNEIGQNVVDGILGERGPGPPVATSVSTSVSPAVSERERPPRPPRQKAHHAGIQLESPFPRPAGLAPRATSLEMRCQAGKQTDSPIELRAFLGGKHHINGGGETVGPELTFLAQPGPSRGCEVKYLLATVGRRRRGGHQTSRYELLDRLRSRLVPDPAPLGELRGRLWPVAVQQAQQCGSRRRQCVDPPDNPNQLTNGDPQILADLPTCPHIQSCTARLLSREFERPAAGAR
jgi:hypothetical protein